MAWASAPLSRSATMAGMHFVCTARCRGVLPKTSRTFGSEPRCSRISMLSAFDASSLVCNAQARCSGD
eukprot:scaffold576_cov260-Pinguiococcus_pyrenoidosus.AAC.49